MEEVVIIGSGVAGLTSAIYSARGNLKPIVFEGEIEIGGQLMLTTEVENFPGFPEGVQGPELIEKLKVQASKFGARFISKFVDEVSKSDKGFTIKYKDGEEKFIETKAVIVATGASARWLNIESEAKFKGNGITTCATCDGFFYREKEVAVVGGGDSACEEALFLAKIGISKVYMIHRRDVLRASKIMQDRVLNNDKIEMVWNSEIKEYKGNEKIESVILKDTKNNEEKELKVSGVFLAIGHIPNTKFLGSMLDVDEHGFIVSDRFSNTSVPGLFAAGDVQDPRFKQAITAAGSGCMAAMEAEKYLADNE